MKYISFFLLMVTVGLIQGCTKDDITATTAEAGIQYNPIINYQEAYPGTIVTFKLGVTSPRPVVNFGIRFLFPGSTAYVSLPEYPDTSNAAEFTSGWGIFEYALPSSLTALDTTIKFKFVASTTDSTYEKEYSIKMKSIGNQRLRLYSPAASGFFKFTALDLLKGTVAPTSFASLTKDIVVDTTTAKNPVTGETFNVIKGWKSGNGTKFKTATAAQYTAATSTYATAYASIAAASEFVAVSSLGASTTLNGAAYNVGLLVVNNYYIAKVNRNGVFSYVAINAKTIPITISTTIGSTSTVNLLREYLEIEIKK